MELVPQEQLPGKVQPLLRILCLTQPLGHAGGALGGIGDQLALAVPPFADGAGGQGTETMGNVQMPPVGGHGLDLLGGQIVEDLIGGGGDHLKGLAVAVVLDGLVQHADRALGGRTAEIAHAVVHHAGGNPGILLVMFDSAEIILIFMDGARVSLQFVDVGATQEGADDVISIRADPLAQVHTGMGIVGHGLGDRAVLVIDGRADAPCQLLGREAVQTHVGGDGGQGIAEAEAVSQENIGASFSEFLLKKAVAQKDLAHVRLGGGNVGVAGIPLAARYVPAALGNIFLELLVHLRVVFLGQLVAECAFKVHAVVGVLLEMLEVLDQGVLDVVADGCLNSPVPLGIQMGVSNYVEFFFISHVGLFLWERCTLCNAQRMSSMVFWFLDSRAKAEYKDFSREICFISRLLHHYTTKV